MTSALSVINGDYFVVDIVDSSLSFAVFILSFFFSFSFSFCCFEPLTQLLDLDLESI